MDIAGAYKRYAESIRRHIDKLTDEEKRQAVLDVVLKRARRRGKP